MDSIVFGSDNRTSDRVVESRRDERMIELSVVNVDFGLTWNFLSSTDTY